MPDKEARLAATHLIDAIQRIRRYISGMDEAAFLADPLTSDAVALNLLVIGENASRFPIALRRRETSVDWRDVVALRNRIAHGYESLSFPVIWSIVAVELDDLEFATNRMIAALEGN